MIQISSPCIDIAYFILAHRVMLMFNLCLRFMLMFNLSINFMSTLVNYLQFSMPKEGCNRLFILVINGVKHKADRYAAFGS